MTAYTTLLVAFLFLYLSILFLFRLRSKLGLAPLYMLLGALQGVTVFVNTNKAFDLIGKDTVYSVQICFFSVALFAILLVYIMEGAKRARGLLMGVVISHVLFLVLFGFIQIQKTGTDLIGERLFPAVFMPDYKDAITNVLLLTFESVLLVVSYQFLISRIKNKYFFLILLMAFTSVLVFDAFAFNLIHDNNVFGFTILETNSIMVKLSIAIMCSILLYVYIFYIDIETKNTRFISVRNTPVFSIFKDQKKQKSLIEKRAQAEQKLTSPLEIALNKSLDGLMSFDTQWCYTYVNKKAGDFFGKTARQLLGKHIWTEFPEAKALVFYTACNTAVDTQETQHIQEYFMSCNKWYEGRIYPSGEGVTVCFIDITEQKKAELALKATENHLRKIVQTVPECILQLNIKGELMYINPVGLAMIEADSLEGVKGQSFLNIVEPTHHEVFKNLINTVFKGNSGHLIFQIKALRGTNKWLETHLAPSQDNDGKITSLLGVTRDITNNREVEAQLLKDEKISRYLLSNAPVAIFQTNKVGFCNYVNEEWIKYAGLSFNEAMGYGWSNAIHPDDKERVLLAWQQSVLDETEFVSEYRFQTENNKITCLSVKAVGTFDAQNNLYGYIGMALDITEQKRAEKQLKENKEYLDNIISNIGDPVFVKDDQSRLLIVNDAFCEIFNLKREDVIGKTLAENVSPEEKEIFLRIDKKVMTTGIENVNEETLTVKGKEAQIISTKKTRFIDANGNKYLIGIIRDITTRKKAEIELEKHKTKLEELIKIRTEEVNLKNEELQRMNKLFVGRELRMKELKTIIKEMQLKNDN